ncbi:uncharacterized protein PV06_11186 [Exophiala oligosperma]|uniref:Uncharacterized protein n=1 Tax=Exophiala oligosperma TaxID=215243 RepID=A0A0D2DLM1_9EURO|nr:uncharacterized protein PV06_11186 [Exophiala oligosperma]KIW36599.1 hypothetical protein PV06_11186 [Exophiala oligosperma]
MTRSSNLAWIGFSSRQARRRRQKLHDYYGDKEEMTDEQENDVYENLIRLAREDSLHDLSKTLQELYDSCD